MSTSKNRFILENRAARLAVLLLLFLLSTITEVAAQNFWQQLNGPLGRDIQSLLINASGHIFAGTNGGGVFRSINNGGSWTQINIGLTNLDVEVLAINSIGHIFAGTDGGGVFRSMNNGDNWTEVNDGLTSKNVKAIAINRSNGYIFVGAAGIIIFRSKNNGDSWTQVYNDLGSLSTSVQSLTIKTNGYIFAGISKAQIIGSDYNIFRSIDDGASWVQVETGIGPIRSFAINTSGNIFAGSFGFPQGGGAAGVFRSIDNGISWVGVNTGLTSTKVQSLATNSIGHIFAGTLSGVFRSTDNGENWMDVNTGLTNNNVYALAVNNTSGQIFAGTSGGGVFQSVQSTLAPIVTTNPATKVASVFATLNGAVNPNSLSTTVKFQYDTTTSYGSEVPATPSPLTGSNAVSVSAAVTGISPNTMYHYRVVATNSAGTTNGADQTFLSYPSSLNLSTTVNFESRRNASDYKAADYRIVGLPGALNQSVKEFLSGQQNKDWQVYRDNGAASNFFETFDGSANFQFSVGRAFWIISKKTFSVNTTTFSAPLNAAQEIEVPLLQSGWNLIANPFIASVLWSKIQTANNVTEPIWSFNGSFAQSDTFKAYIGYYFFNETNLALLKIPYSAYFSASTAIANADSTSWQVNIALSAGEFTDKNASFGIASNASPGLDRLDFRKPRAIAATPTVSFIRPEWDANYSTFATDIRPEFETSESWEFDVRTNQREASQLTFSGISRIPSEFEVYLIDAGRVRTVNLREDSLYHFTPAAELSKFSVVVGKKEAVQEKLNSVTLPKEFALGPNYPNPFSPLERGTFGNPTTTIPVAVPVNSEIKLKIYNLLGAEVKTIYDSSIEAGRYWFNWDGKNELGNSVATGVYLYRLTTRAGVTLLGKMVLMR